MSVIEDLEKIQKLKEQGILSEEEFETQKQKILGKDVKKEQFTNNATKYINKVMKNINQKIKKCKTIFINKTNRKHKKNFCINCGNELKKREKFCGKCGTKRIVNKENYILGMIAICIVLLICVIIYNKYNANVNNNITNSNISETQSNETIYKEFTLDAEETKKMFDGYWLYITSTSEDNINVKYEDWQIQKQQVSPYYNIAFKNFYITSYEDFAGIAIYYDSNQNVVAVKFTGINLMELDSNYVEEYFYIALGIPTVLSSLTDGNEELKEYLVECILNGIENNYFQLNEVKQGIKFAMGNNSDGYFNIEICLEEYAQN